MLGALLSSDIEGRSFLPRRIDARSPGLFGGFGGGGGGVRGGPSSDAVGAWLI